MNDKIQNEKRKDHKDCLRVCILQSTNLQYVWTGIDFDVFFMWQEKPVSLLTKEITRAR